MYYTFKYFIPYSSFPFIYLNYRVRVEVKFMLYMFMLNTLACAYILIFLL